MRREQEVCREKIEGEFAFFFSVFRLDWYNESVKLDSFSIRECNDRKLNLTCRKYADRIVRPFFV